MKKRFSLKLDLFDDGEKLSMKKRFSLKLDLFDDGEKLSWCMFYRTNGPNPSVDKKISSSSYISPAEILSSLNEILNPPDISRIRAWGGQIWHNLFPQQIINEIESSTSGDILFNVPPEWANIPFELCYISNKGFLGQIFQIGTIIRLQTENTGEKELPTYNKMLIIADPAENLTSAHREGMHLKQFAKKSGLEIQLIATGQRSKILDAIKTSSIVHFAGHSFDTGNPHTTGWEIGPDMVLDLTAIEEIGKNFSVPWLIFSNSCHASNCSEGSNLSGIAGAFLKAGVWQVIAPIKRINDCQASEFARSFYKYLFKGRTPAESIFSTKQKMHKSNTNFVTPLLYRLYGDPRFNPRASESQQSSLPKLVAKTLLGIGIIFFIFLLLCFILKLRSLTILTSLPENEFLTFKEVIRQFGKEHYVILKVKNKRCDEIIRMLQEKEKIDVVMMNINKCSDIQVEEELQDIFDKRETLIPSSVLQPMLREHLPEKERRYFIPFRLNLRLLFVNKPRFNDFYADFADLPDIWTWPDVFKFAKKTKKPRGKAGIIIHCADTEAPILLYELIRAAGGDPVNLFDYSSMEAISFLRQLWPYVSSVDFQTATRTLLADSTYMGLNWCSIIRDIENAEQLSNFEVYTVPKWGENSKSHTILGGDYLAMPKEAKHPTRALKFMHFLISYEVQEKLAKKLWWTPIRTDTLSKLEQEDKYGLYFMQIKKALVYADPLPAWWNMEISKIYSELFRRITSSNESLDSLLDTFQKKINSFPGIPKKPILEVIQTRGKLVVALDPGYPPIGYRDEKGNIVGFDIDVAEEMAKAMDVRLVLVNTAWDGIIPALRTKKFDIIMSGMTITPDRNLRINFADPYIVVGQTVLLNKEHEGKVKTYKDLNNPKYIVTSKLVTTGEQAVKDYIPKCTYKSFKTEEEAIQEVIDGRADAFVYDKPCCAVFMKEKGTNKLVFLDEPFTYEPLAWGIRKGDLDFLNWLNNFLRQIKNDGRYEKIKNKWIRSNDCYNKTK